MDVGRRIALPFAVAFLVGACAGQASPPPATLQSSNASSSPTTAPSASPTPTAATLETVTLAPSDSPFTGNIFWESLRSAPNGYILRGSDADGASLLAYGSPDGRSWSRYAPGQIGNVADIVAGPLGWVLSARPADGGLTHLWFSADGLTWGRLADQADIGASTSTHLESGVLGFALTGWVDDAGSATLAQWISRDGRSWSRAHAPVDSGIDTITVLDHAFVGSVSVANTAGWSTVDGIDWRSAPVAGSNPDLAATVLAIPSGDDVVVLAATGPDGALVSIRGQISVSAQGVSLAWGPPTAPTAFSASSPVSGAASADTKLLLGFDQASFKPVSWRSTDGLSWARADLETTALGGGVPRLLAGGPRGWLALGWRAGGSSWQDRQPWRSDDGLSWQAVDSPLFAASPRDTPEPCPATAPTLVEDIISQDAKVWPACFGSATLKIRGYMADCGGCGGMGGNLATPTWLIDPFGYAAFYLSPAVVPAARGGSNYGFQVDPAHPIKVPPIGTHVEVAGHFDDRASVTCRVYPAPGNAADLPPAGMAIELCRETFVATGIRILGS